MYHIQYCYGGGFHDDTYIPRTRKILDVTLYILGRELIGKPASNMCSKWGTDFQDYFLNTDL